MASSQNGWVLDPPLRQVPVPESNVTLSLVADTNASTVLAFCAWAVHKSVAALKPSQCGGYDKRPIGSLGGTTSNHRSGTAIDLNYTDWPQGPDTMSAAQKAQCRLIVAYCDGVVRWGGDYTGGSKLDQQHWELNTTDTGAIARLVTKIRAKPASGSAAPAGGQADQFNTPTAIVGNTPTATTSPTAEPLPPIGPAAEHAVIPLVRESYFDKQSNRFELIRVAGVPVTSEISGAVITAQMSFSSSQIGQFSMTVADTPDGSVLGSGLFAKGTTIDWGDQHLDVRSLDFRGGSGAPTLTVKARSRVISTLKGPEHIGKGSWGEVDVTRWVLERCREAGAIPVVQGNLGTLTFTRQQYDQEESTWDVMQRAAKTVGVLCYEFEQIITFMRPTALADRNRARWWDIYWNSHTDYTNGLAGMPTYSWSLDGQAEAMTFELVSIDADLARPGDGVTLHGNVGPAFGEWMVTDVTVPISLNGAVQISCARVIDPAPQAVNTS